MTQREWTLRGGDAEAGTVLVITADRDRLDTIASQIAEHGYYTFVAVPDAVAALVAVTQFDLVVVLDDVASAARDQITQICASIGTTVLTLAAHDEGAIVDRIRSRIGK